MVKKQSIRDLVNQIDTVHGICPQCEEQAILVAIVTDYYRITKQDKEWLKKHKLGQPSS